MGRGVLLSAPYVYDLTVPAEEDRFVAKLLAARAEAANPECSPYQSGSDGRARTPAAPLSTEELKKKGSANEEE